MSPPPKLEHAQTLPQLVEPSPRANLSLRLTAFSSLSSQQLRDEWRRLFRAPPPRMGRDLLIRALAYRVQELDLGGLSKAALRQLAAVSKESANAENLELSPQTYPRPGARLVREWRGRAHTVVVTENGFDYGGKTYPSLTRIAQVITGVHWSGPRFFGCLPRRKTPGNPKPPPLDQPTYEGVVDV